MSLTLPSALDDIPSVCLTDVQGKTAAWSRPLFRWAGSKRALVPFLLNATPSAYSRYVEPFAGSACLFFALRPENAILGDFNTELIQAYQVIKRHPRRVSQGVRLLKSDSDTYYRVRSTNPESLDDLPRTIRFVYLNRHCFNGVYRTNRSNQFNVPMGNRHGKAPNEAEFYRGSIALRGATLLDLDFEKTLQRVHRNDFVYVDPPYSASVRATHGEYGYGSFKESDVARLVQAIASASRRGANILLSYTYNEELLESLLDWSVIKLNVLRQVGAAPSRKKPTVELLASNSQDLQQVAADSPKSGTQ